MSYLKAVNAVSLVFEMNQLTKHGFWPSDIVDAVLEAYEESGDLYQTRIIGYVDGEPLLGFIEVEKGIDIEEVEVDWDEEPYDIEEVEE